MPRREPLATRQARSRKVQELQPPSLQDETKNGGSPHEKVERHIRFDLSRNQFFFLPSKTQLKKQALVAQAQNIKPSLLLTALNTRSVLKKHTQLETQNTSDKVTLIPPDNSQDKCCTPKLVVAENADSDIRIPESSRNELEKTQVDGNGLQRAVPKDGNSHVDTAENEKPTSLRDTPITTVPESTNTIPSKPDPTEKGITPICSPNDAETIHDVSSLELLSLLKYPASSFSVERFSRKRSQKSAQNTRYGKHNFAPIRSVV